MRVHGGTAPLSAAVEAGKDYGVEADAEGDKLAFAAELAEMFKRPLMSLGSAVRQHFFCEKLARVRCGPRRKGLIRRSNFTGHGARRIFLGLDGKKRIPVGAVEEINETLL